MIKKINKGIVYKGAKRKLAFELLSKMYEYAPNARNFYDLFGGGGSMSIIANHNNYNTHYNEIDKNVFCFIEYIAHIKELPKEILEFVSKAEFRENKIKLKNKTAEPLHVFKAFLYCYGADIYKGSSVYRNELYESRIIENLHNLIIHNSKEAAEFCNEYYNARNMPCVFDFIQEKVFPFLSRKERRMKFVNLNKKLEIIGISGLRDYFIGKTSGETFTNINTISQTDLSKFINSKVKLDYKEYKNTKDDFSIVGVKGQMYLDRLNHLERLDKIEDILFLCNNVKFTNLDYRDVEIKSKPNETIIYCDIPYKDTEEYANSFNHDEFYLWCLEKVKQGYKVFISEYNMPENMFECIFEKEVYNMLGYEKDENNAKIMKKKTEKLFIPKI